MRTVIPEGYRMTIESWENDADNYKTVVVEGLSHARVKFIVEACSMFRSKSQGKGCYGNMYEPDEEEIRDACLAFMIVMLKHSAVLERDELDVLTSNDMGQIQDFITQFMGDLLGNGEGYWVRVFDGVKVEYVPGEIILEDVTGQFV